MSFDQDPSEQANISGADLAIMADEIKALQTQRTELLAALKSFERVALDVVYAENAIEAKNAVRSLNSEIDRARATHAKYTT